jgi:hypothetical protein
MDRIPHSRGFMTPKQKILRNTRTLRESIRPDVVELANRSWTDDERSQIRGNAALCVVELNELIERLSPAKPKITLPG